MIREWIEKQRRYHNGVTWTVSVISSSPNLNEVVLDDFLGSGVGGVGDSGVLANEVTSSFRSFLCDEGEEELTGGMMGLFGGTGGWLPLPPFLTRGRGLGVGSSPFCSSIGGLGGGIWGFFIEDLLAATGCLFSWDRGRRTGAGDLPSSCGLKLPKVLKLKSSCDKPPCG